MAQARRLEDSEVTAVLDSNALIDVYSLHNLAEAAEPEKKEYRIHRSRNALLLVIYLDEIHALTYGLREAVDVLRVRVPPGTAAPELAFTTAVVHFVKDYLVPHWESMFPTDESPRSNAADRHLEEFARVHAKPLITCEAALTARARRSGVEVFSPREFWDGRLDVERGAQRFLRRFRSSEGPFLRTQEQRGEWSRVLVHLFEFYRYLLLRREP